MDRDTYAKAEKTLSKLDLVENIIKCLENRNDLTIGVQVHGGELFTIYMKEPEDRGVLLDQFKAKKEQLERELENL